MNKFALFALSAFGAFAAFAGDGVGGDEQQVTGGTDIAPDSGDGTAGDDVVPTKAEKKQCPKKKSKKVNKEVDKKAAADWTAKLNGDMGTKGEVVSGGEKDTTVAQ